jgi:capping protein alpha
MFGGKKYDKHLRLATGFLVNAPPGEFESVAADLEGLTGNAKLVKAARDAAYLLWAQSHALLVPLDGNNVLVADEARVSETAYINPYTQTLFKFDSSTKKFKSTNDHAPKSSPIRAQLQQLFVDYARTAYKATVGVGVYEVKNVFIILLRSSSVSTKNFRTGNLIARYKLKSSGKLHGTIQVTQHYFETGNVMCHQGSKLKTTVTVGDLGEVVAKVKAFENEWLRDYVEAFTWLFNEGTPKLRRKLPVSGTKINWEAEFRGLAGMATGS